MEFLGHRGAADHLAALHNLHAQARHREIGRAGEAVMARPNDDNVGLVRASFSFKKGGAGWARGALYVLSYPALLAVSPYAPLRPSGRLPGIPPPAPAGFQPEF